MNPREEFIQGLRDLADWLTDTPDAKVPQEQRLLLALSTNPAVEAFAAEHGLTVVFNEEGNASADLAFGPVTYHAYGYVDFDAHCDAHSEREARLWAASKGLALVEVLGGAA